MNETRKTKYKKDVFDFILVFFIGLVFLFIMDQREQKLREFRSNRTKRSRANKDYTTSRRELEEQFDILDTEALTCADGYIVKRAKMQRTSLTRDYMREHLGDEAFERMLEGAPTNETSIITVLKPNSSSGTRRQRDDVTIQVLNASLEEEGAEEEPGEAGMNVQDFLDDSSDEETGDQEDAQEPEPEPESEPEAEVESETETEVEPQREIEIEYE